MFDPDLLGRILLSGQFSRSRESYLIGSKLPARVSGSLIFVCSA
jgi:hypothetical protein